MSSFEQEIGHDTQAQEKMSAGWEQSRQNEVVARLLEGEDLQHVMEDLKGFKEAFTELDTIHCSDGRVSGGKKIGIAGSGILLPAQERQNFIEACRRQAVKKLTAHRDCGAANIAFKNLNANEIPEGVNSADDYGIYCGQKMAQEIGGVEYEFLDMPDMANEYHNEVAIVLDQTGQFDADNLENFPTSFICSGAGFGLSEDYMKTEMKTLAGIGLGDHGFGARFNKENPLYLIVAANDHGELFRWENIAKAALAEFGERISVKGFIKPNSSENN